jgi:hypothetical protein
MDTKKRGRKPKETTPQVPHKKRGRKPKIKEYGISHEPVVFNIDNISDNLLHLDKISKDEDLFSVETSKDQCLTFEPYNQYEFKPLVLHDISPIPPIQKIDQVKEKVFDTLPSIYSYESWPKTTNIYCWWCCHQFDTVPIPYPVNYCKDHSSGEIILRVKGCFCSFNCSKSWGKNTIKGFKDEYLLFSLFKKMSNKKGVINIKPAPDKSLLRIFGGFLEIDKFRDNFVNSVKYELLPFPVIGTKNSIEMSNKEPLISKGETQGFRVIDNHQPQNKPIDKTIGKNTLDHFMSMSVN